MVLILAVLTDGNGSQPHGVETRAVTKVRMRLGVARNHVKAANMRWDKSLHSNHLPKYPRKDSNLQPLAPEGNLGVSVSSL